MTTLTDAISIRDRALALLAECGRPQHISGIPVAEAHLSGVSVVATDFVTMDKTAPYYQHFFAPDEAHGTLEEHALEIWFAGKGKVMSFRWNDDGSSPSLISFKRGPWEAVFTADAEAA